MSIRIMSAVWGLKLGDSDKLVLLALADQANDDGVCWPSMASLAAKCSKSDRTVQAAIKSLVESGHLSRLERPGKGVRYTVHPRSDCTPEAASPPKGTTSTPEAASDKPSRTITSQKTTSSSKARARKSGGEAFAVPDWIPADAWSGWLEMRRQNGKRPTRRALELAIEELRKLADAGHPPGAVLDQSTLRQWTGLFPIKDNRNEQHHQSFGSPGSSSHRSQHGGEGVGKTVSAARSAIARLSGPEVG
ncbi:Helix-turn-helix domain-containing protein [Sphingomonas laterariae]|uniref:Helix-turn-helix domain-containing protein n=1 Tax=Edaphosphingomonas laterariae TaxID=861865 RepID=A0A239JMX4_9SPHN|nr:helix-turn-helix domain-containing protein [Sphingomonas laterariae]SNT07175.1 Helix-turn-helix domain-containing protein [Sphingomonas laterariae]